ncbi:MAG: cation:proton antiporter, partial [Lachnospiraceae bacterium]|nr:cation:proton antiporter [Lachnospiraceae bacterium]
MENYRYLLDIALILLATKAFGLFTRRLQMPSVVGSLLAGIILGPALLNIVQPSDLISSLSEIGVIVLMFEAGLDTSITDLKNAGLKALWIALLGVLVPLAMGFLVGSMYNVGPEAWLENLFIGVILTATSVGITVETLKEMGAMKTHSGNTILAAAVIDDVLGIVALTLVSGMADSSINIGIVLLKVVLFFIFSIIVGIILHKVFAFWFDHDSRGGLQRYSIVSFAFALIMAFVSEEFFGVADITGSFVAGLMISGTSQCAYVTKRISTLSYLLITPIFFANIGLGLTGIEFNGGTLLLILIFCVVAVL